MGALPNQPLLSQCPGACQELPADDVADAGGLFPGKFGGRDYNETAVAGRWLPVPFPLARDSS